jgi:hypothetical protein
MAMRRDPAAGLAARFARETRGVNLVGRFVAAGKNIWLLREANSE